MKAGIATAQERNFTHDVDEDGTPIIRTDSSHLFALARLYVGFNLYRIEP